MTFLDAQIKEYEAVLSAGRGTSQDSSSCRIWITSIFGQDAVGNMLALDGEIEKARTELRAAEQRRDALRRQLASEDPVFLSDPGRPCRRIAPAGVDPLAELDSRADALRRNLDELLRKYTEEHPDVVGTRRILADLEKQREAMLEASEARLARRTAPAAPRVGSPTWSTSS